MLPGSPTPYLDVPIPLGSSRGNRDNERRYSIAAFRVDELGDKRGLSASTGKRSDRLGSLESAVRLLKREGPHRHEQGHR
jgi:hypothetical protein